MEKSDNELVAEFMGLHPEKYRLTPLHKFRIYWCLNEGGSGVVADMLKYDTSWDWLMPVVEKIGTMSIGFHVNINSFDGCHIYDDQHRINGQGKSIRSGINGNLIQVTYKAVVEFIKWHNQQKKEL